MNSTVGIRKATSLRAIALIGLALIATVASARPDKVMTLDIEPQSIGSAMVALGESSGVQIILPEAAGADASVKALVGEYRLEEALTTLLSGTGLAYEFASENTVVVRRAQESADEHGGGDAKAEDEEAEQEEDEPVELEAQRVTGSRLQGGDPTANVISITAEDMARRGISTMEELFRQMPWAYASNTSQSSRYNDAPVDVDREMDAGGWTGDWSVVREPARPRFGELAGPRQRAARLRPGRLGVQRRQPREHSAFGNRACRHRLRVRVRDLWFRRHRRRHQFHHQEAL